LSDKKDTVEEIMTKTVRTIGSDGTVGQALEAMAEYDIGSLVLVQGNTPVGIVTERDFARKYARERTANMAWKINEIASRPIVSISPDTKVWDALDLMVRKKIRRLPVLDGGNLVGIVTERDIFKWVIRVIHAPNLPADLKQAIAQNH
jgi:CBS domain-containing protein